MRLLNTFPELFELQAYMNDLINEAVGRDTEEGYLSARYSVPVDVLENDKEFVVKLDLPGYKREDINVLVNESNIEISAHRPVEDSATYIRQERITDKIHREIEFGVKVDQTAMKATYNNGVLTLHCPKKEDAKPRQIPVIGE